MPRLKQALLVLGLVSLAATGGALGAQPRARQPRAVPGEVIVKFQPLATAADRGRARAAAAGQRIADLARTPDARAYGPVELVRVPAGASLQAVIATLRRDPAVEYAEPNWIYTHQAVPNDPRFPQQWALENTGQAIFGQRGVGDADIDALDAWAAGWGQTPVYVGVIDEGIDLNHPDLGTQPGGVIWTNPFDPIDGRDNDGNGYVDDRHGWDFVNGDRSVYDGSAADPSLDSHGTHVAGTIAARTGNGVGVAGVSPGTVVIPAKFLGVNGGTTAGAILAVDYFTDLKLRHNLNIVATNNSWSGGGYSQALRDAIGRGARQDILFIAASGNAEGGSPANDNDAIALYPGNYDTTPVAGYDAVITVTATGQSDELRPWANYGYRQVDLGAPGSMIVSTAPQNTYIYSSGTSMAAPHVTGGAALLHALRGLQGLALREALFRSVDPVPSLAGKTMTGGRLNLGRAAGVSGGVAPSPAPDIVLYASRADKIAGNWAVRTDATAAGGSRIQSTNLGAAKVSSALASPASYFEIPFQAEAGTPYRLWIRGRAENNSWANDSVHVQFDRSITSSGAAAYRFGTSSSLVVNLEDCSGCGLSGWGWQDTGYGSGVLGPTVTFATSGSQRIRVQIREDGIGIDQILLSPARYISAAPGALKNDTRILTTGSSGATSSAANDEVVLYAADATVVVGRWTRTSDGTAAGSLRMQNANAGAAKITTALALPADYIELTFQADAGKPYRLWIRGRALNNSWANDSVHVQFNDSVTAAGAAIYRIGTSSGAGVNLEDCSGCGLSGWGWQDNGYGVGVRGPEIRFAATGAHRVRIQVREDGFGIDQVVLSAVKYLTAAPGGLKNDATILPRTGG